MTGTGWLLAAAAIIVAACGTTGGGTTSCDATILVGDPPDELRVIDAGPADEVWALAYGEGGADGAARVGETIKVVWSVPAGSAPSFWAESDAGATVEPVAGPNEQSSNWERVGAEQREVGTIWELSMAGCWTINVETSPETRGQLVVEVVSD